MTVLKIRPGLLTGNGFFLWARSVDVQKKLKTKGKGADGLEGGRGVKKYLVRRGKAR